MTYTTMEQMDAGWLKYKAEIENDGFDAAPAEFVMCIYDAEEVKDKTLMRDFLAKHGHVVDMNREAHEWFWFGFMK